ncbi:hypothetical protein PILCRDRAFT_819538 [Piloderma croceum F 1598]|uniref:Uncharacterized protein n=1 Tax=Piloderma croceum (strain F 1598) TaxID=765440 RepID=A0A0C3C133_PILCF|nr:hypothetical protein PILCRDRAFT_819538 [Piloderma croceum F 1598]
MTSPYDAVNQRSHHPQALSPSGNGRHQSKSTVEYQHMQLTTGIPRHPEQRLPSIPLFHEHCLLYPLRSTTTTSLCPTLRPE